MWKKQSALVAKSKIIPLTMSHNYQVHNRVSATDDKQFKPVFN